MYQAEYPGVNTFLRDTCRLLLKEGICRDVRGKRCVELPEPYMFKITNPTARIITIPERNWYAPLAYGESLWLASGKNDMDYISNYGSNLKNFSDDGQTMRGGYGPRLRHYNGEITDYDVREKYMEQSDEVDQFRYVVECFEKDINTRQAIITIGDPMKDCFDDERKLKQTKDIPCTRILHFIKDAQTDKLNLIVTMRSNDLIWGASAVNIFNFTFMQEYFAAILGLEIGSYYHIVNNMHFYDDKRDIVEKIALLEDVIEVPFKYNKSFHSLEEFDALVQELLMEETLMRKEGSSYNYRIFSDEFFMDWYNVLYHRNLKKNVKFIHPYL
jgi:thymidylate synthase